MNPPLILIGSGGHATVLADMAKVLGRKIIGFMSLEPSEVVGFPEIPYLGDDSSLAENYARDAVKLINGVGAVSVPQNHNRERIFVYYKNKGYFFETLVHPSAILGGNVTLGEGTQVMAGAILQPNVTVGQNTIINTRASVDHDAYIGHHVHVAPGVTICGNVKIGSYTHVGVSATLIQGLAIPEGRLIRAGETVISTAKIG